MSAEVELACQKCGTPFEQPVGTGTVEARCPDCGWTAPVRGRDALAPGGLLGRCLVCDREPLYAQKDFNRVIGVLIVTLGAVLALALGAVLGPAWFYATLAAWVVLDFVLYRLLPVITVCYRCQTVHRGFPRNPSHGGFDLETSEWTERQFTLEMERKEREGSGR